MTLVSTFIFHLIRLLARSIDQGHYKVYQSKAGVLENTDIRLIRVLREHELTRAAFEEVYLLQFISLVVDLFFRVSHSGLQQRADPRDELLVFPLEEVDLSVDRRIDMD